MMPVGFCRDMCESAGVGVSIGSRHAEDFCTAWHTAASRTAFYDTHALFIIASPCREYASARCQEFVACV